MYLELRTRQIEACREAVENQAPSMSPLFGLYFDKASGAPGTSTIAVVGMPAIGWRTMADLLSTELYLPGGRANGKARPATRSALKQVSRAVIMREAHPGLKGGGVAGHVMDMIPAWQGNEVYSPYPTDDAFMMLWPQWETTRGVSFTTWAPRPTDVFFSNRDVFQREDEHFAFVELHDELVEPALDGFLGES